MENTTMVVVKFGTKICVLIEMHKIYKVTHD